MSRHGRQVTAISTTASGYNPGRVGQIEKAWTSLGWGAMALAPLGGLYALGWWSYQSIYTLGVKKPYRPCVPVLTVGNLIAGGAGKTPVTLYVARLLRDAGVPVVASLSGYGFPRSENATLTPNGQLEVLEWGDEPAVFRDALADVPLVVGRDRVMASQIIERDFPKSVMVMDDGFQHLRLAQDVSLVLDPGLPNQFCLPAGPYREPKSTGRKRATLTLPSDRFQVASDFHLRTAEGLEVCEPQPVQVLTAIARPYRLHASLEALKFRIERAVHLPDHDPLAAGTLLDEFDSQTPIVVTAKDWVKLRSRKDVVGRTVLVADVSARVTPESEFRGWLMDKLDEAGRKTRS